MMPLDTPRIRIRFTPLIYAMPLATAMPRPAAAMMLPQPLMMLLLLLITTPHKMDADDIAAAAAMMRRCHDMLRHAMLLL